MLVLLWAFFIVVNYHGRLVEEIARLDFLWQQLSEKELNTMTDTRHNNSQLLRNILPDHVAQHFLSQDRPTEVYYILYIYTIQKRKENTLGLTQKSRYRSLITKSFSFFFLDFVFATAAKCGSDVCEYSQFF